MEGGLEPSAGIPVAAYKRQATDTRVKAAGILFVDEEGRALFTRRSKEANHPGEWDLPGGGVDEGETAEEGARRETQEEVGINPGPDLIPLDAQATEEGVDYTTYLQRTKRFVPQLNPNEHDRYIWAKLTEPPEPLHDGLQATLHSLKVREIIGDAKKSHEEVHYRSGDEHRRCETCTMFRAGEPPHCTAVADPIIAAGDCDIFEEKKLAATDSALMIALDRESVREVDLDGRMHVGVSNISKANVCPYKGKEIPGYEDLGLDDEKVYFLLRDPDELRKSAPTFNRVQLLKRHTPVSADDHKPYDVVGTTGSDCTFEPPYLRVSLTIWEQDAIDGVKSGDKRELSCGYHYVPDMTPGVFQGEKYDGVMRQIVGNHVAIVEDGRAGPDVVVGDSAEAVFRGSMRSDDSLSGPEGKTMTAKLPTKFANLALQLTARSLRPVLAQDAKIDLMPIFADLTSKNFPGRKAKVLKALEKATKGKLAKDASLSHITELLDHLEHPSSDESVSGPQHRAMAAAAGGHSTLGIPSGVGQEFMDADRGKSFADAFPEFLRGKGLDEESIKEACDMAFGSAKGKDEFPPKKEGEKDKEELNKEKEEEGTEGEADDESEEEIEEKAEEREKPAKDNLPAHEGTVAAMTGDSKKGFISQQAFDEALKAATKGIRKEVRQNERDIRLALDEVRPYVGELRGAEYETPKQVYASALKALGMDAKEVDALNREAMKIVLKHMPKRTGARPPQAQDSKTVASTRESFEKKFPGLAELRKVG